MFELTVKDDSFGNRQRIVAGLANPRPLMRRIAGLFESETEANFAAQGRPRWLGLSPATRKRRGADAMILQDSGRLAASIVSAYGADWARIGSNLPYAPIHQFGGVIQRAAYSSWGSLRLDRSGALLRQGKSGPLKNLAVFGKASHKRVRQIRYTVGEHQINVPARPYLPAGADGKLTPTAMAGVETETVAYLRSLVGG